MRLCINLAKSEPETGQPYNPKANSVENLETRQLCTFYLDSHFFGVDARSVQEVIRFQEMTHVPSANECVSGLINLRGQIVTAIDMRKRLGMEDRPTDKLPMNVVIRCEDEAVSLLVDQIGDVIEVSNDQFETPPNTLQGPTRKLVEGAYKLEDQLLLVLNTIESTQVSTDAGKTALSEQQA